MRILLVNWNDRANPHAGGAEVHLHAIFGRLAGAGHVVDLVASGWPGASPTAEIDGIRVRRVGGRQSFAWRARRAVRAALQVREYDIVVEDMNKLPLFLPCLTALPLCAIVPHLFGTTAFAEASWPVAALVWAAERPIPRVYARAGFHAISRARATTWWLAGSDPRRFGSSIRAWTPTWYRPDPREAGLRARRSCTSAA